MSKTKTKKQNHAPPAATLRVDMDKKCPECGGGGSVNGGRCLKCASGALNRRPAQPGLPGAEPELDAVGRAADEYRRVILDLEELQEIKKEKEESLIEALKRASRRSIRLGTVVLTLTHKDAVDKISVKKGK